MSSVGGRPQYEWYKERLRWMITVRNAHIFRTPEDLKQVLKLFPYTESFCGMGISRIGFEVGGPHTSEARISLSAEGLEIQ